METNAKLYQLVRVAELYYEQQLSQIEIAERMGVSRSTVSRILAEAHELGVVEITIHRPVEKNTRLSEQIQKKFDLREVVVVRGGDTYDEVLHKVGIATSELLLAVLKDNMVLGISWGATLYRTIQVMRKTPLRGVEVVQLMGSLGSGNPSIDGPELALRLAEKLNGGYRIINAPAVVKNQELRDHLLQQPQISAIINLVSQAEVMLTGIGSFAGDMSSLMRAGYITIEEKNALQAEGAVGHLLAQPIDIWGNQVGKDFSDRVVAAPLEYLRKTEWSIGCSGSALKAPAVLGAIRGKYYNALVIDEASAREILLLLEDDELPEPINLEASVNTADLPGS
jgi:deoxyribonucleoside regulator